MRLSKFIIILLAILLLSITFNIVLINFFSLNSFKSIPIDFKVGDHSGFNADKDALHFGTLLPGTNGFRDFQIQNLDCNKCKITMKTDIDWIVLEDNNFILNKGETRTLKIYLYVPSNASIGNYNGSLNIYLWKTI